MATALGYLSTVHDEVTGAVSSKIMLSLLVNEVSDVNSAKITLLWCAGISQYWYYFKWCADH